ncbi:MAG: hypothetical protein K0U64_09435 [Actinomycetia bacterium]|nr:hypothetical protein [Actinomycetes bacterium]
MAFGRKKNPQPEAVDPSTPPPAPPPETPRAGDPAAPIQTTASVAVAILPGVPLPVWAGRMALTDQLLNVQSYVATGESLPGSPRPAGTPPQWQPEGGVSPDSPRTQLSPQWVAEPENLELRQTPTWRDESADLALPQAPGWQDESANLEPGHTPTWQDESAVAPPQWVTDVDTGEDSDDAASQDAAPSQDPKQPASGWAAESGPGPLWIAEPASRSSPPAADAAPTASAAGTTPATESATSESVAPQWQPVATANPEAAPGPVLGPESEAPQWQSDIAAAAVANDPTPVADATAPAPQPEPEPGSGERAHPAESAPAPDRSYPVGSLPPPASAQRLNQPPAPSAASRTDQPIGHIVYGPGTSPQTVASALQQATDRPYVGNDAYVPDLAPADNSPAAVPASQAPNDTDEPDEPEGTGGTGSDGPGPSTGGGGSPRQPNSPVPGTPTGSPEPRQSRGNAFPSPPSRTAPPPPPATPSRPAPPAPPSSQSDASAQGEARPLSPTAVAVVAARDKASTGVSSSQPVIDLRGPKPTVKPGTGGTAVPLSGGASGAVDESNLDLTDREAPPNSQSAEVSLRSAGLPDSTESRVDTTTKDRRGAAQAPPTSGRLPLTTPLPATTTDPGPVASNSPRAGRDPHLGRWLIGASALGGLAAAGTVLFVNPGVLVESPTPAPASQIALPGKVAGMKGVALPGNAIVPVLAAGGAEPLVAAYSGDGQGATVWLTPQPGTAPAELFAAYRSAGGKKTAQPQSFSPGARGGEMQCAAVNAKKSVCFWGTGGITGGAEVTGLNRTRAAQLVAEMRTDLEPR